MAFARSLGACGIPVIYVTDDTPLPGWSRFVRETVRWPGPHDEQAVPFLLDAAKRRGWHGYLLVAGGDAEVRLVSEHRARLAAAYSIILPDWQALSWLCEKPLLYKRAAELGVRTPSTHAFGSAEAIASADVRFPVVLKPNMGGGNNAFAKAKVIRADDMRSFQLAFRDACAQIGAQNVVVQELIPGGGESQFSYAALWNEGKPVAELTARRSRQYPVDFGYTSTCVEVLDEPEAAEAARTMLASVGFSGLVEVEFKRDGRDGALKLLDVNPRPWSWFGLCRAAGIDLGAMLWDVSQKRPVRPAAARQGVAWVYLVRDVVAAIALMRRGDIGAAAYMRSLRKARSWATFALDDPLPGLIDIPLTVWRVLTRRILG
ncbi:ATP-grasp domain-containing protein [Mesorhizobium sp. ZMM04-5]|uniref:ATP-grasp domain-containing protein n=1 Tax=Mesorhizobium marinum TaxID=3228790 RepID=A0ABV3R207_9HYPH